MNPTTMQSRPRGPLGVMKTKW